MKTALLALATVVLLTGMGLTEPVKVGIAAEPYPPFLSPEASGT